MRPMTVKDLQPFHTWGMINAWIEPRAPRVCVIVYDNGPCNCISGCEWLVWPLHYYG